jgi:hypothetical protein
MAHQAPDLNASDSDDELTEQIASSTAAPGGPVIDPDSGSYALDCTAFHELLASERAEGLEQARIRMEVRMGPDMDSWEKDSVAYMTLERICKELHCKCRSRSVRRTEAQMCEFCNQLAFTNDVRLVFMPHPKDFCNWM